jgi:hypothetical protein
VCDRVDEVPMSMGLRKRHSPVRTPPPPVQSRQSRAIDEQG